MASTSEEERLKAEIAKLSGAIHTHKQHQQHHQPQPYHSYAAGYTSRGRGHYTGAGASTFRGAHVGGRGGYQAPASFGRGRGRGAAVAAPQRNRTLILNSSNKAAATASADGSVGNPTTSQGTASSSSIDAAVPSGSNSAPGSSTTDGWVKRKSTHNMSLVSTSTFQRTEPARLAAMEATRKAKAEAKAAATSTAGKKSTRSKSAKPSASVRRGDNMGEVVIDGVVFEFDPSGTKLVKKPIQPSSSDTTEHPARSSSTTTTDTSTPVPLKTSINGQDYIRTKRGNLISADLLAKRKAQREAQAKMGRLDKMVGQISTIQATRNSSRKAGAGSRTLDAKKARTLCTFFNKTGQCKRGLSCPYLHDSSKIALCPKVLRPTGCTLPKGTCPLSHTVRSERVPHCVHYLRSGMCRNGGECLYTHADLKDGTRTKICRDFSDYGWCDRGKLCEQRHTYECPDFVEKGRCERKGCKLVHVIRADQSQDRGEDGDGGGVQDGDLFVRDDAAAEEASDAETDVMHSGTKRKRPLMQTELDDDQIVLPDDDEDGGEEEDEQVNFANVGESRSTKRRKAKAFTQQKDFISFDDDQDKDDESEDSHEDEEIEEEDEMEEAGSVHSEEFELSDDENEEDDGDDHIAEGKTSDDEPIAAQADDDDDDDDLVDRDL